MALVKCPECNKEISNQSKMCPHCGYKTNSQKNKRTVKLILCLLGMVLFIVLIAVMIFVASSINSGETITQDTSAVTSTQPQQPVQQQPVQHLLFLHKVWLQRWQELLQHPAGPE